jgi:hypothetical protein
LVKAKSGGALVPPRRKFGLRDLGRTGLWGLSAAAAIALVAYAGGTETGRARLDMALGDIHEALMPTGATSVRPLDAREGQRLAETVQALTADRARLMARLASLEQSLDGITGSIARVEKAVNTPPETVSAVREPAAAEATSSVNPAATAPAVPAPVPAPIAAPAPLAMPPQPAAAAVSKPESGLDLGSASTIEALRTAWTAALRRHGALLEGLYPVVQIRERPRPGPVELRLIAGPVPSPAVAARLCAAMAAAGAICAPALFDGQRLAGR